MMSRDEVTGAIWIAVLKIVGLVVLGIGILAAGLALLG